MAPVIEFLYPGAFQTEGEVGASGATWKSYCVPVRFEKVRVSILCGNVWTFQSGVQA
jgi:hypothetical protein